MYEFARLGRRVDVRIQLEAPDNVFHLALGLSAVLAVAAAASSPASDGDRAPEEGESGG